MSTFMSAAAARDLHRRARRPRASHVTPQLNARLAADLDEQIEAARGYAEAMIGQSNHALAGYGFGEMARMGKLRDFYKGESEERDDDEALQAR